MVVDLSSFPTLHKLVADGLSSLMMHLGGASERWMLQLYQSLTPLMKIGGGSRLASSFFQ
jgi:hypothetical protein